MASARARTHILDQQGDTVWLNVVPVCCLLTCLLIVQAAMYEVDWSSTNKLIGNILPPSVVEWDILCL